MSRLSFSIMDDPFTLDIPRATRRAGDSKRTRHARHRSRSPVARLLERVLHPRHARNHKRGPQVLAVENVPEARRQNENLNVNDIVSDKAHEADSTERLDELCKAYDSLSREEIREVIEELGCYSPKLERQLAQLSANKIHPGDDLIASTNAAVNPL